MTKYQNFPLVPQKPHPPRWGFCLSKVFELNQLRAYRTDVATALCTSGKLDS
jgi:hypothetical protein